MGLLFAAAGGLIEAQDEALAGALSKAAEEPAGLQSLGLIRASKSDVFELHDRCVMGAYGRVGPEDVSDSPLERIAQCAEALQPSQFSEISERATTVSQALSSAAEQLNGDLNNVLGSGWQGEFAASAQDSVAGLVNSALALSGELEKVATKAERAHDGFVTTRRNIAEQTAQARSAQFIGQEDGPAGMTEVAESRARLAAAEQQARAIVNTEYSPAVMDANLDDLDFTAAYRVVSTSALGGPNGVDMARIWNTEGIPRPAQPAAPNPAAIAAITGGADGAQIGGADAPAGQTVTGTTTNSPTVGTDAATEQALLAARAGTTDGTGTVAPSAGQAGAGGGVNAATTAAGAPFAPVPAANSQQAGAGAGGAGGIGGIRGGVAGNGRDRDRGFGSTAGLVGGGGAAAAGAGASRMGGAGTLAGLGSGGAAGPGAGSLTGGAPGAGSAGAGAAGPGAGGSALSSSSSNGAQAGRAGAMPMGGMMGAAGAGQNNDRRGHTPASYLTNATNTTAIIGDPVKVAPAVLGRAPAADAPATSPDQPEPFRGRVIGRDYTGGGATRQ